MNPVVVGLLGSLAAVVGLLVLFIFLCRRHRRTRPSAGPGPVSRHSPAAQRRGAMPFHLPPQWLAIRSTNTAAIREALRVADAPPVPWSEALAHCRQGRTLFVSPPVDGWTLVIGGRLPAPGQDVDHMFRFLTSLSRQMDEVQFFHVDRVLSHHAWARLRQGEVIRAYAWADTTQWNQGPPSREEGLLGLRARAYGEEAEAPGYGELSPERQNTDRVMQLARRWSLDPVAASELLLEQEAEEADGGRH